MIAYLRHLARCALLGGPLGAAAVTMVVAVHQFTKDRAVTSARTGSASGPHPSRGSDVDSDVDVAGGSGSAEDGSPVAAVQPRAAAAGGYVWPGREPVERYLGGTGYEQPGTAERDAVPRGGPIDMDRGMSLAGERGPELHCVTLDDRLGRYLRLRGHTISTDRLTDHEAIAAQAAYVFGEARELRDAARAFQRDGSVAHLNDVWAEMADVALCVAQLRRTMRRVGVPCPPVEQLIEEKTQADVGRG